MSLEFPGLSSPLSEERSAGDSAFLPTGPFSEDATQGITAEGSLLQKSWKVGSGALTTQQILAPLRQQVAGEGFEIIYECEAKICGGFDFRYLLDILPEPDMHVNLGDYRYVLARRMNEDKPEYASLIVSRSANAGFVQLTRVGAPQNATISTSSKAPPAQTIDAGPVGDQLESSGHATLADLVFKRGKSELGDEAFQSLSDLADYLSKRPDRTVVLVGHTDSEGSLSGNMALSKRRAAAVVSRLVDTYGVSANQVSADGVGFLSPIATNLTAEGRALNRRVEVILSSTE